MRGGNQPSSQKTMSLAIVRESIRGEAGDPVPIAMRTDLDDEITGEDGDGGVTASSIVVGEDRLVTSEIAMGGYEIAMGFSFPSRFYHRR